MNFNAANEKSVFSAEEPVRFKGSAAVLSPPPMFGMGTTSRVGQLPGPAPLGFSSKPMGFETPFSKLDDNLMQKEPVQIRAVIDADQTQFPLFTDTPKIAFGLVSDLTPLMLLNKVERELGETDKIDHERVAHDDTAIRVRAFGDLNNAEFEIRVFSFDEGKSYAEFNRLRGDSWVFGGFAEKILNKLKEQPQMIGFPDLPPVDIEYGREDLEAMLTDVEESYQDIAEHSAAELAVQTNNDAGRELCDRIEGFCPRVLKVLEESTNCAIVRSLLICLTNMAQLDGLTKRILGQQKPIVQKIESKWGVTQKLFGGLFSIAPSQEVQRLATTLLVSLSNV